ncbi:MAG TPA: hypothetical protein VHE83_09005 [Mycobacteriales bacterium]|nr:hypothetical protein [Mycobacteriales bacterium]
MRTNRFNVWPILRGHWKALRNHGRADVAARFGLLFIPLAVFAIGWGRSWRLGAPTALLSGLALLAGALLGSFTHLSTLRMKVSEWSDVDSDRYSVERDQLDETAAHLLTAALAAALAAASIVVGLNVQEPSSDPKLSNTLSGFWGALALGLGTFVLESFIVCLPRLYSAYVEINKVPPKLSGFAKGR